MKMKDGQYSDDVMRNQIDEWDPDIARMKGTLKSVVNFMTDMPDVMLDIQISEPKLAIVINKKSKIVRTGIRNKNELF